MAAAAEEGELLLGLNQAPSMNAVLRALKKEDSSLYNCVASIADDAGFVQQMAALYPSLPLFPNLRCGVWYARPPLGPTCYFKSTDGHNNNWSFSTVRLNLQVAEAAAAAGGCVIVDATRRGKRFPDAMSKTIPMWAAVMNRAVLRLRQQQAAAGSTALGCAEAVAAVGPVGASSADVAVGLDGASSAPACDWDCDVHLPPWVSQVEANSIRQRLDGWVEDLLGVRPDLSGLAGTLNKPLRCMWVSQDSSLWLNEGEARDATCLPFTPVVLVGASATTARQRRCLTLPAESAGDEPLSVTYTYFPGAADDEESWACGLTADLMWRHLRALLAAGPGGIEAAVQRLLQEQLRQSQGDLGVQGQPGAASGQADNPSSKGGSVSDSGGDDTSMGAASAECTLPASVAAAAARARQVAGAPPAAVSGTSAAPSSASLCLQQPPEGGLHCLLPRGCQPAQSAAVQQLGSGIFLLGETGLALGSAAAAAAPAVWQHVDSVLHLGVIPLAGMAQEPQPASAGVGQAKDDGGLSSSTSAAAAAGAAAAEAGPAAAAAAAAATIASCRYGWLPVLSSKEERHSLEQQLPAALAFAREQLCCGRRLLLCCDAGLDAAVCAAVACLLALFHLEQRPGGGGLLPVWAGGERKLGNEHQQERDRRPAETAVVAAASVQAAAHVASAEQAAGKLSSGSRLRGHDPNLFSASSKEAAAAGGGTAAASGMPKPVLGFPPAAGAAAFSKLAVRQHLAVVSAHYPAARPTRGMLKQVFNFFLEQLEVC